MTDVAKTILAQLGGNKFIAMTGANSFVGIQNMLKFAIPTVKGKGINRVVIILDQNDTYTVKFAKYRNFNHTIVSEHTGIYYDMLQDLFTRETGLFTRL